MATTGQFDACLAVELSHVLMEHDAGDAADERIDNII